MPTIPTLCITGKLELEKGTKQPLALTMIYSQTSLTGRAVLRVSEGNKF